MAASGGSEAEGFFEHNDSSETLSEAREHERLIPEAGPFWLPMAPAVTPATTSAPTMIPIPTTMTSVTVPNVPGMRVNIVPGLEGAAINIHPFDPRSSSSAEITDETSERPTLGGSLFLGVSISLAIDIPYSTFGQHADLDLLSQHLTSYPSVVRVSHFIRDSLPLGPTIFQSSRFVVRSTKRTLLRPLHATPFDLEAAQPGAEQRRDPALRRLLHYLDATAADTLRGIDQIIIFLYKAGGRVRRWIVSSASQVQELADYFSRTYYQETKKWAGTDDIIVFCGAMSFTVAVGAFDAVVYIAEWLLDGQRTREIEMRQTESSV